MSAKNTIKEIKRTTKKRFTAEQKIQIVLEGLRGEIPITDLCRRENLAKPTYYTWSKAFLEGGKSSLQMDSKRNTTSDEVKSLTDQNADLRRAAAEQMLENIRLYY